MRKFFIICLLCPIGFSCDPPAEESTTQEAQEWTDQDMDNNEPDIVDQPGAELNEVILEADASEWLIYEGTIPCTDCKGIKMRLKIENKSGTDEKSYELTETYINTKDGDRTFQSRGVYQISYGYENNPAAVLITLVDKNNVQRVLIQDDAENLRLLDTDKMKTNSQHNYTLSKI